jgi:molecular chaperone DnaJ
MRDPYDVLGVARTATPDEIKSAYRRLARQYHPDVNPDNPEAEEKFKEIGAAYSILSDPEKKARFDQYGVTDDQVGAGGAYGAGSVNFTDLFDMFFGGAGGPAGGGRSRVQGRDGDDLRADVQVSLSDVITGVQREVKYRRPKRCQSCDGTGAEGGQKPETCSKCSGQGVVMQVRDTFLGQVRTSTTCPQCRGAGQIIKNPCGTCKGQGLTISEETTTINVPPGVDHGLTIHYAGLGGEATGLGSPGDLYVVVSVKHDRRFDRHGQDLATNIELTFAQAAIGDTIAVEGVDEDYDVDVPPGTQPGDVLTVKGAGLPPIHGGRRGDLHLQVSLKVPKKISDAQIDLLRQFAELGDEPIPKGVESTGILGNLFKKKK